MATPVRTVVLALAAALALGACAQGDGSAAAAPAGYHRMPDGTLMANAVPADDTVDDGAMDHSEHGGDLGDDSHHVNDAGGAHDGHVGTTRGTEYQALGASGVAVTVHRSADTGELVLGAAPAPGHGEHAGHGGHAMADPADFPDGILPARLRIPSIEVDASVEVGSAVPSIGVSDDPAAVTWLAETRRPGQIGPAVIGGEATAAGAGTVLARLDELAVGDDLVVVGDGGDELRFTVAEVRAAPTSQRSSVFAVVAGQSPEVRLVAWAGGDDSTDLVVRAVLVD